MEIAQQLAQDSDDNGVPDIVDRLLNHGKFGPSNEQWRYRRLLVFVITGICFGSCLAMGIAWLILSFMGKDIGAGLVSIGGTFFWGFCITGTTTASVYTGVSQMDMSQYRKVIGDLAANMPTIGNMQLPFLKTKDAPTKDADDIGGPASKKPSVVT